MSLGPSGRRNEPLHVIPMAFALILAAFLGGALGLVWYAVGADSEQAAPAAPVPD